MRRAFLLLCLLAPSTWAGQQHADWGLPAAARPWLGVMVTEVEVAGESGPRSPGLSIAKVVPGGPAAAAGLVVGDVIVAAGGQVVDEPAELLRLLEARRIGDVLELVVLRERTVRRLHATLRAAPPASPADKRTVTPLPPSAAQSWRVEPKIGDLPAVPTDVPGGLALTYAGSDERASLGVETMDLGEGLARYFGTRPGQGVLIEKVHPRSPAALAGLRAGDVLVSLAGSAVDSGATLTEALRQLVAGERVVVGALREGRRMDLSIALGRENVPVWIMQAPAAAAPRAAADEERSHLAMARLYAHERREAERLEVLLEALEEGDEELVHVLQGAPASRARPETRVKDLRGELARLRARLRELETELAQSRPHAPPVGAIAPAP